MGPEEESNQEDIALMALVATGDEASFGRLIEKHQHAVIGTIAKMTSMSPDSQDLAQQVFLRVWKSAKRYKPTAKFTTWLFTITRNLVFNYSRQRSRRKESSLDEIETEWHQQSAIDSSSSPDRSLQEAELQKKVDRAIASLPEKQRLAVILRQQEKMPYEEIAKILKLSVPAVKSTLFRARNVLREQLEAYLAS